MLPPPPHRCLPITKFPDAVFHLPTFRSSIFSYNIWEWSILWVHWEFSNMQRQPFSRVQWERHCEDALICFSLSKKMYLTVSSLNYNLDYKLQVKKVSFDISCKKNIFPPAICSSCRICRWSVSDVVAVTRCSMNTFPGNSFPLTIHQRTCHKQDLLPGPRLAPAWRGKNRKTRTGCDGNSLRALYFMLIT